jgi:hypothetical protein
MWNIVSHVPPFAQSASALHWTQTPSAVRQCMFVMFIAQLSSVLHCTQTIRVVEQYGVRALQLMSPVHPAAQRCVSESQTSPIPMQLPVAMHCTQR